MATTEEAPPRWLDYVDVEDLVPDPRNPKAHDDDTIDASLDRFGYVEPIAEDLRTGMLVAGHGRRERILAAKKDGKPPPEGVTIAEDGRWLVPVNRGWSSENDDEAFAYLVASNQIGPKGGWINDLLAAGLQTMSATPYGLEGLGFDSPEVEELLRSSGLLAAERGSFLDGLAAGGGGDPMHAGGQPGGMGDDVVNFQLPMSPGERDELMLQLRQHQRALGTATLAATLQQVVRTWQSPAPS